jgi:hypothetical protein
VDHEEYHCKHGCGFKSDYESVRRHEMKGHRIRKKGTQKPSDSGFGAVGSLMLIFGVILVWVLWGVAGGTELSPGPPAKDSADLCGLFVLGVIGLLAALTKGLGLGGQSTSANMPPRSTREDNPMEVGWRTTAFIGLVLLALIGLAWLNV